MSLLDAEARLAYALEARGPLRPWEELPEWIREAWRCEVDGDQSGYWPAVVRLAVDAGWAFGESGWLSARS